jgi:hypothetical protein
MRSDFESLVLLRTDIESPGYLDQTSSLYYIVLF